jgi:tRNA modification GTPase
LVSDIPGTTRDVIRQMIQIRGVPLHIIDTAGLRESQDEVENLGIARTHKTLHSADVILVLLDARQGLTSKDEAILTALPPAIPRVLVFNKIDLTPDKTLMGEMDAFLRVSAKTGEGLEKLRETLLKAVGWHDQEGGSFMARERHLQALMLAQTHLNQAHAMLISAELFAEELRLAQHALSGITGKFTADDLLGEIFSRFCIGK